MKRYYSINSNGDIAIHETSELAASAISEFEIESGKACPQNPPGTHGVLIQTGHCCRCSNCGGDVMQTVPEEQLYEEFPWITAELDELSQERDKLQAEVDRLRAELLAVNHAAFCDAEGIEHCPP